MLNCGFTSSLHCPSSSESGNREGAIPSPTLYSQGKDYKTRKGNNMSYVAWWEIPEFLENVRHTLESVFDYCYEEKILQEQIQIIDTKDCYLPVEEHLQDKVVSVNEYEDEEGNSRYVFRVVP